MEAMTRRRVLCGLLLASAVLACFAGWLWIASGSRMTRARFEQVEEGMSLEEVIRTAGGPPLGVVSIPVAEEQPGPGQIDYHYWSCDDAALYVHYYARKATTVFVSKDRRPPTPIQKIFRWLGL
jgi:hypothetical protein